MVDPEPEYKVIETFSCHSDWFTVFFVSSSTNRRHSKMLTLSISRESSGRIHLIYEPTFSFGKAGPRSSTWEDDDKKRETDNLVYIVTETSSVQFWPYHRKPHARVEDRLTPCWTAGIICLFKFLVGPKPKLKFSYHSLIVIIMSPLVTLSADRRFVRDHNSQVRTLLNYLFLQKKTPPTTTTTAPFTTSKSEWSIDTVSIIKLVVKAGIDDGEHGAWFICVESSYAAW